MNIARQDTVHRQRQYSYPVVSSRLVWSGLVFGKNRLEDDSSTHYDRDNGSRRIKEAIHPHPSGRDKDRQPLFSEVALLPLSDLVDSFEDHPDVVRRCTFDMLCLCATGVDPSTVAKSTPYLARDIFNQVEQCVATHKSLKVKIRLDEWYCVFRCQDMEFIRRTWGNTINEEVFSAAVAAGGGGGCICSL
ncbi:hypothetical protein ACLOJK_012813 [Asimina triloba]